MSTHCSRSAAHRPRALDDVNLITVDLSNVIALDGNQVSMEPRPATRVPHAVPSLLSLRSMRPASHAAYLARAWPHASCHVSRVGRLPAHLPGLPSRAASPPVLRQACTQLAHRARRPLCLPGGATRDALACHAPICRAHSRRAHALGARALARRGNARCARRAHRACARAARRSRAARAARAALVTLMPHSQEPP